MQHWIVHDEALLRANWLAALPQATALSRERNGSGMPGGPGILWYHLRAGESLPQLSLAAAQQWVLLSDDPDESLVVQALAGGAAGCCNSHAAPDVLRQVALVVGNGGLWVGQSLLQRLVGSMARILSQQPPAAPANDEWSALLSEREVQVARLVAAAASNREIAERLSISERTVKAHLTSIFEKLDVRDRLQLSLKINGLRI